MYYNLLKPIEYKFNERYIKNTRDERDLIKIQDPLVTNVLLSLVKRERERQRDLIVTYNNHFRDRGQSQVEIIKWCSLGSL